jgi:hypothetical protein
MNVVARFATGSFALLFALFLAFPITSHAQSADTAALEVYVTDPSKAMVMGAKLHLLQKQQNISRDAVTDKSGHYRFTALPVGDYVLTIDKDGFGVLSEEGITLSVSQEATLNIALKVADASTEVTVDTQTPLVDVDRTTIGQTISTEEIENLPSNNRNYLDFALTVPGITSNASSGQGSGLSANGGRQRSNSLLVDGVENNGYLNGTFRQTISLDAVSQFQVMTNQFLPEYGQASGAIINLVTKSGTDTRHGDLYYYVRNPALNAASSCHGNSCATTDFYRNDFGATYGGPIYKGKTFIFASGEYIGQSETDSTAISPNVLPVINTALAEGFVKDTSVQSVHAGGVYASYPQTLASIRIDHSLDARDTLLYRFLYAHYNNANPAADAGDGYYSDYSNYGKDNLQAYSMVGEWTHILSPTLLNELHFQFAPQNMVQLPNSSGPSVTISSSSVAPSSTDPKSTNYCTPTSVTCVYCPSTQKTNCPTSALEFGPNTAFPTYLNETHYEWTDALSLTKGNHLFKFGTDDEIVRAYTSYPLYFQGHFSFSGVGTLGSTCTANSVSAFGCGFPYEYIQSFGNSDIHLTDKLLSGYIEDQWKAMKRLTINYGVRYDVDLQPQGYNQNMSDPIQAPLPKGIPRDYNNIAPRLGIAWALDKKGTTVLSAGYGMFYDKIFLILGRDVLLTRATLEELDPSTATPLNMIAQWAQGPYPQTYNYPATTIAPSLPPSVDTITKSLSIPVTHEATMFLDHQFAQQWAIDVAGLFVSGQHLLRSNNTNLTPPVILTAQNATALGVSSNTPIYSQDYGRSYFGGSRINPSYNNITTYGAYGHSTYSALRATVLHRATHGLTLRASYVWSKSLDDGSDFTVEPANTAFPQGDKGLSTQDQRNLFIGSTIYRFPYQAHVSHNSPLRWVFGSWIGSVIYIQGSGQPENITTGTDSNDDGAATDRPFINGTNGVCTYDALMCPNAGATPIMAARNSFRGARQLSNQIRLQREFLVPRGYRLIFSAEAFNAINHSYVTDFNTFWGNNVTPSTSFGGPDAWSSPRSIQLGMKASF